MRPWLCSLYLLVCGFISTSASPPPLKQVNHHKDHGPIKETHSLLLYDVPDIHHRTPPPTLRHQKRAHTLRIHSMSIHRLTIPIFSAAPSLALFYTAIVRECIASWSDLPPLFHLHITNGFFALSLQGIGRPIPWSLVAEVAGNMLVVTRLGFTGTWDMRYVDEQRRVGAVYMAYGVLVQFRIGEGAGMGSLVVDAPVLGGD